MPADGAICERYPHLGPVVVHHQVKTCRRYVVAHAIQLVGLGVQLRVAHRLPVRFDGRTEIDIACAAAHHQPRQILDSGLARLRAGARLQPSFGEDDGWLELVVFEQRESLVFSGCRPEQFPGLSGISGNRGSARFNVSTGAVAVRGLRFGGSAFTSIPTSAPFAAIAPLVSSFQSGKYSGPGTLLSGKAVVTVAGPGVADNGATEWS